MKNKQNILLLSIVLASGCASTVMPRPQELDTTQELLKSPQAEELTQEQPRLLEDANHALNKANKAYDQGDDEAAQLYATIAKSRFESARNLSQANEFSARRNAMSHAAHNLTNELSNVQVEANVVQRYNQLDTQFKETEKEINQYRGEDQEARKAISEARILQGKALGIGASTSSMNDYNKGQLYIESSLAQLKANNIEGARQLAEKSQKAFNSAIDNAQKTTIAQRRIDEENRANEKKLRARKAEARGSLEAALAARSRAFEKGADSKSSRQYEDADFQLQQAQQTFAIGNYQRASELAAKSEQGFNQAVLNPEPRQTRIEEFADVSIRSDKDVFSDVEEKPELTKNKEKTEKEAEEFVAQAQAKAKEDAKKLNKPEPKPQPKPETVAQVQPKPQPVEPQPPVLVEEEVIVQPQVVQPKPVQLETPQQAQTPQRQQPQPQQWQPPAPQWQQPSPYNYPPAPYYGGYQQPLLPPWQQPGAFWQQQQLVQPVQPQQAQAPAQPAGPSAEETKLRDMVVQKLSDVQMRRAEMLGEGAEDQCPNAFKEFDAILEIAENRFQSKDYVLSLEYLTRADERLRKCRYSESARVSQVVAPRPAPAQVVAPQPFQTVELPAPQPQPQQPTPPQTGAQVQPQQKAGNFVRPNQPAHFDQLQEEARQGASTAINEAEIAIVEAETTFGSNPTRIRGARQLLERARNEYASAAYAVATVTAYRAKTAVTSNDPTPPAYPHPTTPQVQPQAPQQPQQAPQPAQTPAPKQQTPPASSEQPKLDALQENARQGAITAINEAEIAIVGAETTFGSNPTRIRGARQLLDRARNEYNQGSYSLATVTANRAKAAIGSSDPAPKAPVAPQVQPQAPVPVAPVAAPQPVAQTQPEVSVEAPSALCQQNSALVTLVDQKQREVATPPNVQQLILAANQLNAAGSCSDAATFYTQALNQLYTVPPKPKAPLAPPKPVTPAAPVAGQVAPPVSAPSGAELEMQNQATLAIGQAEEKKAAYVSLQGDPSYQVGVRLLSNAYDRYKEGDYQSALLFAKQSTGSFDAVYSKSKNDLAANAQTAAPQPPQQPATPPDPGNDPRQYRREYNQVLDALVARDRARDRQGPDGNPAYDRGLDFLGKARRAWSINDFQGAGRLAVEAKKEFDSVKPPEAPKDDSARLELERKKAEEAKALGEKKKKALDAIQKARQARRDCDAKNCLQRDEVSFRNALGKINDAETAIATEQFDATVAAAEEALTLFTALLAQPAPIMANSPYLSISGDQLVLSPKVTFETGSSSISGNSIPAVEAAAEFFKQFGTRILSINVAGYTDSVGNANKNQRLSAERADAVAQALKARGVATRITSVGYGENNPIASNKTADGREQNRRVEIRFKSQEK